jgi:hypothetical protein
VRVHDLTHGVRCAKASLVPAGGDAPVMDSACFVDAIRAQR